MKRLESSPDGDSVVIRVINVIRVVYCNVIRVDRGV